MERKSNSTGQASVWEVGIKALLLRKVSPALISLGMVSGCKMFGPKENQQKQEEELASSDDFFEDDEFGAETEDIMKHPKNPNAWETRVLVQTSDMNNKEGIEQCKKNFVEIGTKYHKINLLKSAKFEIQNLVSSNYDLHHWCFYSLMVELDYKLEESGRLLSDKAETFYRYFRGLWVLSIALAEPAIEADESIEQNERQEESEAEESLDNGQESDQPYEVQDVGQADQQNDKKNVIRDGSEVERDLTYIQYLRKRYLQIFKEYFGRMLEPINR